MKKTNFLILLLTMLFGLGQASWAQEAKVGYTEYATLQEAVNAANAGDVIEVIKAGDYKLPNLPKNVTIKGAADGIVSFTHNTGGSIASVPNGATFNNVTFNWGNVNYNGFQHAGTINMENCTLNGKFFSYGDMNFTDCQFKNESDYNMWVYGAGNVVYDKCTFTGKGKLLHLYCEGPDLVHKVTVKDCKFVNSGTKNKAAINVKATSTEGALKYELNLVGNNTCEGEFPTAVGEQDNTDKTWILSPLAQVDDRKVSPDSITVIENGKKIYPVNYVASIGDKKYENLQEAAKASKDRETIKLLSDVSDAGNVSLPAGVTFDGDGKSISGNSAIYINKEGGTLQNVNFKNIHNEKSKLSAVYGNGLAGTATITGCSFDNCDWDAIQITPVAGANVVVTNNNFSDDSTDEITQQRYIHVQSATNVDFSATITENVMTGKLKQEPVGVYYPVDKSKVVLSKNYIESINDVCILIKDNDGYAGELVFPSYKASDKQDTYSPVAMIKNSKYSANFYESLEAAFAAALDGETVTLLADCTGNGIKAPQGKFTTGLTVDFAGHTYTVDGATVGSTGTETNGFQLLKDNKITFKNGAISSEKAKILVQNYSDLTLEGMTLTLNNTNYTSAYTLSNNNGNIVIDGTTINANPEGGFAFDVCRYASYPSVSVTVKGESVINGDVEVSASGSDAKDGFKLMLEAGTLNGNIVLDASAKTAMAAAPEKALVMKSETFTKDAPADYKWVTAEEGTLKLVAKEYVAQIGDKKYESLEDAFAASADGDTITLLADCTGNGIKAPQGKFTTGLTVDFAGHTYTVDGATVGSTGTETNGFQLLKDNKITFRNGTISSEKAKILVQNYSDLTLEGMTLALDNKDYKYAYTLSNNNGTVVIDGTTINANPAGGFAFDVCRYSSYPSVSVTVRGESVINGDVEVSASGSDAKDGFSLMLAGGTMSGEIVLDASAKAAMSSSPDKAKVSKSDSFDKAAPADYKWVSNGDGTSTLKPCEYVASIGDKKYESLKDALDAAKESEDIVVDLLADAALDITAWDGDKNKLSIGSANTKSITINGNSHKLTFNQLNSDWNNVATMNDAVTKLVLNDMAISNSGYNNGPWNRHDINFNCAVELNNVTSDKALAFKNSATLKNVKVTDTGVYGIWIRPVGQNISIDGLTIDAERGIKIDSEYLNTPALVTMDIANATFNTVKKSAILVKTPGGAVIKAGEGINIDNVKADKENLVWVDEDKADEFYKVTVEGATIVPESKESDYAACLMKGEQRWGFYKKLSSAIDKVEEGYSVKLCKTTDEPVEVSKPLVIVKNGFAADKVSAGEGFKRFDTDNEIVIREFNPVAAIGEVKYESLEDAFAASADGDTITLLADCSGNGIKAPQGKFTTGLTVDFAGHTYTVDGATVGSTGTETNGFQLLKDNKITFKGGTITSEKAKILIQNYSDLTLEGMTLTLNNTNYTSAYTLSNNNGNIVIDGTTINANPAGGFAFDVCRYASYPSVSVTVKGESVINGDVEVSASNNNAKDGFRLMLAGGTMSGEIVLDASAKAAMSSSPDKAKVSKSDSFDKAAPADYKWVSNGDGTSTLKPCEYVASIGDNKYESLQEAVDAAGTTAATVKLLTEAATDNIIKGNGVKVQAGQNITFDLNGLTYNVDKTVGSNGTETNGFQLLKGSTVKFTNGTVTSNTAKILIQNYSNLTLEGVTVNAGSADYAVSNNFGSMNVTGDTYINAKEGGVAFDLWYGMSPDYDEGIKVNFDEKFTGKVTGKIEYGHDNRVEDENWQEKASLVINAGYFDIDYAEGSTDALNGANIKIYGGSFLHSVPVEYCAEGYVPTEQLPDGRYSVVSAEDAEIVLHDGKLKDGTYETYSYTKDTEVKRVTYLRKFGKDHVNNYPDNYQPWYVPVDYTIKTDDLKKFDFFKIHMIAASAEQEGEVENIKNIFIHIAKLKEGDVLKANKPYVIRPKQEVEFEFECETTLKAMATGSRMHTETTEVEYDFYGTYSTLEAKKAHEFIALGNGTMGWNKNAGNKLGSYRWYLVPTVKDGDEDAYSKSGFYMIEDSEEVDGIDQNVRVEYQNVEGIYTLSGIKIDKLSKGVNIVRYTDGTTKKIFIK